MISPVVMPPLVGRRPFGIGPRRALTHDTCLAHARQTLASELSLLDRILFGRSKVAATLIVDAALLWAYDLPGHADRWQLLRGMMGRATQVIAAQRQQRLVASFGQTGAVRYACAEALPAALLACVCVDTLAALATYQVTLADALTHKHHAWTVWDGPFVPALIQRHTHGVLPVYTVHQAIASIWTGDRIALANRLLPSTLWDLLGHELSRMVWAYIAVPTEALTLLHTCLDVAVSHVVTSLDLILHHCLRGTLQVNTLPGQVFILPEGTFCATNRLVDEATGVSVSAMLHALRAARCASHDVYTLTCHREAKKSVVLQGILLPHLLLHFRCQALGLTRLLWYPPHPTCYAGLAYLVRTSDQESVHAE